MLFVSILCQFVSILSILSILELFSKRHQCLSGIIVDDRKFQAKFFNNMISALGTSSSASFSRLQSPQQSYWILPGKTSLSLV